MKLNKCPFYFFKFHDELNVNGIVCKYSIALILFKIILLLIKHKFM